MHISSLHYGNENWGPEMLDYNVNVLKKKFHAKNNVLTQTFLMGFVKFTHSLTILSNKISCFTD